jgi:hypothetical protein
LPATPALRHHFVDDATYSALIPYLRRALRIQSELTARRFLPDAASTFLLDKISIPAIILSETYRLVRGNEASTDLSSAATA